MTTIKITELSDIGNGLANSTLVPVVNMSGTPTTERANLNNISDFVLNKGTGANLGAVGDITITGGTDGYVLQTDGTGNLSWTAQTGGGGNGTPGGANTQVQYNDAGSFGGESTFTYDKNTNMLSVGNLTVSANASIDYLTLTHDANANVVYANYLYGDGSNITNLPVGNIATINLTGSTSNVLYGNGVFAPITGSGNSSSISNGSSTVSIPTANGAVVINPATTSNIELTTSSLTSVSADCYIGLANEFVADTEFNDDITVVQVGWTVTVSSVEYTVTAIDPSPPANQYRITVAGATFVSGTNYTFTNPMPVDHAWSIDQYGTMTTPAGGTINQINNDFKIEVTGTDVIDLRTGGGDFIFDAAGNVVINGPINSSTGVARLDLTGGNVYLTSTDNDTTVLAMNTTRVQMYAGVDVSLTSGVLLPQLETDYTDSRTMLEESFTQNSGEAGYPWGITLPVSYLTYNELILLAPDTFPNQAACTVQANNTQNTWELWQDTIAQSNVRITSNELNWTFGSDGILNFPGGTRIASDSSAFEVQNANAVNFEANAVVNIYTDTSNAAYQWQFGDDGNLSLPNNGSLNVNGGGIYQTPDEDFHIRAQDAENDGWGLYLEVDDGLGNVESRVRVERDSVQVGVGLTTGPAYYWGFDNQGRLNLPDGGNIQGAYGSNSSYYAIDNGSGGAVEMKVLSYIGDSLIANIRVSNPNVTVSTGGGASTWTFDNTGNLTVPNNILVAGSASPAPYISGFSTAVFIDSLRADQVEMSNNAIYTNSGSSNLILNPNYGSSTDSFIQVPNFQDGGEKLTIKNSYANGVDIVTQGGTWFFGGDGNLTLPGNTVSINFANGSAAFGNIVATNLDGNVSNVLLGDGTFGTVPGLGNIASINLDGSSSNVLYGNGEFAAVPTSTYSDSNVVTLLGSFGSNTISTTGNIAVGAVTASGKIGYSAGANVTQTGSRSNSVTINGLSGEITLFATSMTAGQVDFFTVTNNQLEVGDMIICTTYAGSAGTYLPMAFVSSATQAVFTVRNLDAFVTASESPVIKFIVIKAPKA